MCIKEQIFKLAFEKVPRELLWIAPDVRKTQHLPCDSISAPPRGPFPEAAWGPAPALHSLCDQQQEKAVFCPLQRPACRLMWVPVNDK